MTSVDAVRPDETFPRRCRILAGRDFERVMRAGRKVHTRNFIVFATQGGSGDARLGLAIGRKVGGAVCRNRWRRLIREAFRLQLRRRLAGTDVVVAVKAIPGPPGPRRRMDGASEAVGARGGARPRRIAPGLAGVEGELLEAVRRLH